MAALLCAALCLCACARAEPPPETSAPESTTSSKSTAATTTEQATAVTTTAEPATAEPTTTTTTVDIFALQIEPPEAANAEKPLFIKTYDGYNQPCHPKVLYFEEGWNGYEFWMAYTPYPYCEDSLENPSIAVSRDGVEWGVPEGLKNPVSGLPPTFENSAHYSDPHILMNGGTMELWFRHNPSNGDGVNADSNGAEIFRITSVNGADWSKPELMLSGREGRNPLLSPVVMIENGGYTMWYTRHDGKLYRITSGDGSSWSPPEATDFAAKGHRAWHQDIIKTEKGYEAVVNAKPAGARSNLHDNVLFYAMSKDGLHWTEPVLILSPASDKGKFDGCSIYRSSLVPVGGEYFLYYTSMSERYIWNISLCRGETISSLKGMGAE